MSLCVYGCQTLLYLVCVLRAKMSRVAMYESCLYVGCQNFLYVLFSRSVIWKVLTAYVRARCSRILHRDMTHLAYRKF